MATALKPSTEPVWQPQPGGQEHFLSCPYFEVLFAGTRGNGKTDALLMDFAQHVGQGYGAWWRGVIFRRTYKQLADIETKTLRWFKQMFPSATYNASDHTWKWPTGEQLLLRYMEKPRDYWEYHGWEAPWVAWEELTAWPTLECYEMMKACCRSSCPDASMPRKYRATTNPYGIGHNAVKAYFVDPAPPETPITNDHGQIRVLIEGSLHENRALLDADPEYLAKLESITDPNLRKAWLEGSWDINAGGMFDDVFRKGVHILPPFKIPPGWRLDRSMDWGSAHPFSVCWWAESDGTTAIMADGTERSFPPKTIFHIAEWYGWNGVPNEGSRMLATEIARGILKREKDMCQPGGIMNGRIHAGPADHDLFEVRSGECLADDMARLGVRWEKAEKGRGSRETGWEQMRTMFKACLDRPMEERGLFVFDTCRHFIRTVPSLPRDESKMDDVDTDSEDHIGDCTRYRIRRVSRKVETWNVMGYT